MNYRLRKLSDIEREERNRFYDRERIRIIRLQKRGEIDWDLADWEEKLNARKGRLDDIMEKYDREHGYIIEEEKREDEEPKSVFSQYGKVKKSSREYVERFDYGESDREESSYFEYGEKKPQVSPLMDSIIDSFLNAIEGWKLFLGKKKRVEGEEI